MKLAQTSPSFTELYAEINALAGSLSGKRPGSSRRRWHLRENRQRVEACLEAVVGFFRAGGALLKVSLSEEARRLQGACGSWLALDSPAAEAGARADQAPEPAPRVKALPTASVEAKTPEPAPPEWTSPPAKQMNILLQLLRPPQALPATSASDHFNVPSTSATELNHSAAGPPAGSTAPLAQWRLALRRTQL